MLAARQERAQTPPEQGPPYRRASCEHTALRSSSTRSFRPCSEMPGRVRLAIATTAQYRGGIPASTSLAHPGDQSLKALRGSDRTAPARKPLVGFGDPVFRPDQSNRPPIATNAQKFVTRAYTDFWRGIGVDRARLSEALPPLRACRDCRQGRSDLKRYPSRC